MVLPRLAITDVGHPSVGPDSGEEADSQSEEPVPEEWDVPTADDPARGGEEPEQAPRAAMDYAHLPCVVPVQLKNGRWLLLGGAPGRRGPTKGRM